MNETGTRMNTPQRQKAWELLCRYTQADSLRKHARAVESAMRFYAGQFGEDIEYWGTVGLLHDFDYERFPDNHPQAGGGILRNEGYDEAFIRAVMSHVPSTGIARDDRMAKRVSVDELSFFNGRALVNHHGKLPMSKLNR
jgi:predicted hydrolase (HD superfamily)